MSKRTILVLVVGGFALLASPVRVDAQSLTVTSGLQLWFDAADASTIDLDGSNNVTEWKDKSGNGTHMTEATGSVTLPGYSPNVQNGRAAVEFRDRDALENTDVTLSNLPTTQDRTIFAALSPKDNTDSQNWYFSYGQPVDAKWNLMMLFNHGGGWRNFFVGAGSQEIFATVGAVSVPGPATIIEYGYGAPNSHSFLNDGNLDFQGGSGAAPTPLDTNLTNGARLGVGVDAGVSNQSNYDFFELLVYDRALDENERNQVGLYLDDKWGIASNYSGTPLVPGDVNGNGVADINDFNIILANLGNTVTMRTEGDLTGDLLVDFRDFRQWKQFRTAGSGGETIPEPTSLLILLLGAVGLITLRRKGYLE